MKEFKALEWTEPKVVYVETLKGSMEREFVAQGFPPPTYEVIPDPDEKGKCK